MMFTNPNDQLVDLLTAAGIIEVDGSAAPAFRVAGVAGNQTLRVKNVRPGQVVKLLWQQGDGGRTLLMAGDTTQTAIFAGVDATPLVNSSAGAWTFFDIIGLSSTTVAIAKSSVAAPV